MGCVPWYNETGRADWYKREYESLQKKQKWIPVKERLPEDGAEVLVTVEGYENEKDDKIPSFVSSDVQVSGEWQKWNGVIAWMSLPEPYGPMR